MNSENILKILLVSFIGLSLGTLLALKFTNKLTYEKSQVNETKEVAIKVPLYEPSQTFDISKSWSSGGGCKRGCSIFQGEIQNGIYKIHNGYTRAHFAKKFKGRSFEELEIETEIPEPEHSSIKLYIGTGGEEDKKIIQNLRFNNLSFQKTKKIEIGNGMNRIDLRNFEFYKYTFFKVILSRDGDDVKSPVWEYIKIE